MKKVLSKFKKDDKGSFTLEATLVFPTIFIVTIAVIFMSIVIYEKVVVYQKAYVVAERIAFTWDNSKKNIEDGSFGEHEYTTKSGMDGLYWRTNQIGLQWIEKIFGSPGDGAYNDKLVRAEQEAERMIDGAITSVNVTSVAGFNEKVEVTMTVRLKAPPFVELISGEDFEVTASSAIKDPVETVRLTEFMFYIYEKVTSYIP